MGRYKITYELYKNDYNRKPNLTREANSLKEIGDWLIGFATPISGNHKRLFMGVYENINSIGRISAFDRDRQEDLWIHKIELDGMIVFSDGKYTNKQTFVTDEVRSWCHRVEEEYSTPKYNFAPTTYTE